MKVITCVGYHQTGSGAVDSFFKEFDNCSSAPTEYECRFLQDPDGISDLEYNLIDNPHRLNTGYALKRYLRFVKKHKRTYRKLFGRDWFTYSEEYINNLITETYKGYWHEDIQLIRLDQKIIYLGRRVINKLLPKFLKKSNYYNYFPNIMFYHSHITEEKFLEITREYCNKLFKSLNKKNKEFVVLDQLVPTSNTERYIRYVDNLKVIMVDRDPRDLYINEMEKKSHVLPKDVEVFVKIYDDIRKISIKDKKVDNVLQISYEDLLYKYDEVTKNIIEFVGENEKSHTNKKKLLNPITGVKYTRMWEQNKKYEKEIKYIEEKLSKYLHNYK